MNFTINGRPQTVELTAPANLAELLRKLEMKPDRIAVELNGEIVPRGRWPTVETTAGDRLEIVHFVGGGATRSYPACD